MEMDWGLKPQYKAIYDEMRGRNSKSLSEQGVWPDEVLQSAEIDTRVGLGLFAFPQTTLGQGFDHMIADARERFPAQVVYTPDRAQPQDGILHFTFFQLFKAAGLPPDFTATDASHYIATLQDIFSRFPPFTIKYSGLIAVPTGLLMYGYPSEDVNQYRDELRSALSTNGLPFEEPYKTDIVHSTCLRLCTTEDAQELLRFADDYKEVDLGTLSVDALTLGFGSWRMWDEECPLLKEIPLQG
ncbi:MAG: hypothetical protein UZ21_OP11001001076 [Microgenomates bacterium OLB22]|nr:MAG: hypothetical protein UZ21_OP11001001076 [Microgenomates bacterium OLB22]